MNFYLILLLSLFATRVARSTPSYESFGVSFSRQGLSGEKVGVFRIDPDTLDDDEGATGQIFYHHAGKPSVLEPITVGEKFGSSLNEIIEQGMVHWWVRGESLDSKIKNSLRLPSPPNHADLIATFNGTFEIDLVNRAVQDFRMGVDLNYLLLTPEGIRRKTLKTFLARNLLYRSAPLTASSSWPERHYALNINGEFLPVRLRPSPIPFEAILVSVEEMTYLVDDELFHWFRVPWEVVHEIDSKQSLKASVAESVRRRGKDPTLLQRLIDSRWFGGRVEAGAGENQFNRTIESTYETLMFNPVERAAFSRFEGLLIDRCKSGD
jgi:hypothetical protein